MKQTSSILCVWAVQIWANRPVNFTTSSTCFPTLFFSGNSLRKLQGWHASQATKRSLHWLAIRSVRQVIHVLFMSILLMMYTCFVFHNTLMVPKMGQVKWEAALIAQLPDSLHCRGVMVKANKKDVRGRSRQERKKLFHLVLTLHRGKHFQSWLIVKWRLVPCEWHEVHHSSVEHLVHVKQIQFILFPQLCPTLRVKPWLIPEVPEFITAVQNKRQSYTFDKSPVCCKANTETQTSQSHLWGEIFKLFQCARWELQIY